MKFIYRICITRSRPALPQYEFFSHKEKQKSRKKIDSFDKYKTLPLKRALVES